MTFADLVRGDSVFLDANTFVYHFQPHSAFGPPCTDLLKRIELQELSGSTSTHVLSELAHRLMTMEASALFNWASKIVQRLQQNSAHVRQLTQFRSALQKIPQMRIQVLTIPADMVDAAAGISQQIGILSNDALIVAVMRANGLTKLASNDADFDRVPGLTRYAPA
jgi:predicted nucleic acid-binding protein